MTKIQVRGLIGPTRLLWSGEGDPRVVEPPAAPWASARTLRVDPVPAYAHEVAAVRAEAATLAKLFPLRAPVQISIVGWEGRHRTNGECEIAYDYHSTAAVRPWAACIRLWGKRIPPHPAMTRYLVAHEYGHAVERAVADRLELGETDQLLRAYRQVRPVPRRAPGGGPTWHTSVAEIFANDFRILVAKVELEFWPHATTARPEQFPKLMDWWVEQATYAREHHDR